MATNDELDKFNLSELIPRRLRDNPIWVEDLGVSDRGGIIGILEHIFKGYFIPELKKLSSTWDSSNPELEKLLRDAVDAKDLESIIQGVDPNISRAFMEVVYDLIGTTKGFDVLSRLYGFDGADVLDSDSFSNGEPCPTSSFPIIQYGSGLRYGQTGITYGQPFGYDPATCISKCAVLIEVFSQEEYALEDYLKLKKLFERLMPACISLINLLIVFRLDDRLEIAEELLVQEGYSDQLKLTEGGVLQSNMAPLIYGYTGVKYGDGATYGSDQSTTTNLT